MSLLLLLLLLLLEFLLPDRLPRHRPDQPLLWLGVSVSTFDSWSEACEPVACVGLERAARSWPTHVRDEELEPASPAPRVPAPAVPIPRRSLLPGSPLRHRPLPSLLLRSWVGYCFPIANLNGLLGHPSLQDCVLGSRVLGRPLLHDRALARCLWAAHRSRSCT